MDEAEISENIPNKLLAIELHQCVRLRTLQFSSPVEFIYNPLEYAYDMHSNFVHKYCTSTKKILFLGMNPGPWGMSQTGVPFGEISAVKNWLNVTGMVGRPKKEHPLRQIRGLDCKRSEVSGRKFWGLFQDLCGNPETFFQQAFVYNHCPMAFMTNSGKNITPAELKVSERRSINEVCDDALRSVLQLLQVEIIVAIGRFAETRAKLAIKNTDLENNIKIVCIPHPSPRNFSSKNWHEDCTRQLQELNLLNILCPTKQPV